MNVLEPDRHDAETAVIGSGIIGLAIASCLHDVAQTYNHAQGEDIFMGYSALAEQTQSLSDMYAELYHTEEEIKELKSMIHMEFSAVLVDLQDYFENYPDESVNRDIEFGRIFLQAFTV